MTKYIIQGRQRLRGDVSISGNKNSILPCLAAAILTDQEVVLKNVPKISDVDVFVEIMRFLGAFVEYRDHTILICCSNLADKELPESLVGKLRASILLVGPLLTRFGRARFCHPGGDVIGRRGIELHLEGFQRLGFEVKNDDRRYQISNLGKDISPINRKIFLGYVATVTGTENLILASVLKQGTTTIRNCAQEPHVVDLCNLLTLMDAKIKGIGTSTLVIEGVKKLNGTEFTIGCDYIEFGTFAAAAAISGGEILINNCQDLDPDPLLWPMLKMGVAADTRGQKIKIKAGKLVALPRLVTNVWPGFPTDLMSAMIVLATQCHGVSLMHDWIYESRMFFVDKLIAMGANITIADPHRVLIYGPSPLRGRNVETPDIRAGMALVLAALVAEGESVINRAELIERGYEDVIGKLSGLGVKIQRCA